MTLVLPTLFLFFLNSLFLLQSVAVIEKKSLPVSVFSLYLCGQLVSEAGAEFHVGIPKTSFVPSSCSVFLRLLSVHILHGFTYYKPQFTSLIEVFHLKHKCNYFLSY